MYVSALQLPISVFSKAFDCKDSANERNVSLLTNCRVPPIFCKDKHFASYLYFLTENISATLRMFNGNKCDYSVKTY